MVCTKNSVYQQILLQIHGIQDDNHIDPSLNTLKTSVWYKDSDNRCLLPILSTSYYVLTTCHLQVSSSFGVEVNADM